MGRREVDLDAGRLVAESRAALIPNLKNLVVAARAKYANEEGQRRAYLVVNQVCIDAQKEGLRAGLFYKPNGTNYAERSIDVVIIAPGGETFDILKDAENTAEPTWSRTTPTGFGDIRKWRAPVDPALLDPPPPQPEKPQPEPEQVPPVAHPPTVPTLPEPEPIPVVPATENAQILANILSALDSLSKRVQALEKHTETHSAIDARLDKLEAAPYVVHGQTGRTLGHTHSIILGVQKVE
jgi:hypothetical protein